MKYGKVTTIEMGTKSLDEYGSFLKNTELAVNIALE